MPLMRSCSRCGARMTDALTEGLCPACLLKAAVDPGSSESVDAGEAPTIEPSHGRTLDPALGTRVRYFGDYELCQEIARGGMGVVYRARQVSLDRMVALKMILAGRLAGEAEVRRFRTEAEAAARLQHPHIVAIHEVGEHEGHHYYSMELVEGRTLGALAEPDGMSPRRAATYMKSIAEAVQFAHERGTLHRDLKPANVLVDGRDQPRITDFGLAKVTGREGNTQDGTVMGSPSYMPPEQASGRLADVGPRSDVYALGALLYELLTGQPPFRGATPLQTLRQVLESEPVPPRSLRSSIPVDLETICLRCLAKQPQARYGSAREVADELGRFLRDEPLVSRPAPRAHRAASWAARHPWAITGAVSAALFALVCVAAYLYEENAFLRARQADPGLARVPGALEASMEGWRQSLLTVGLCLLWLWILTLAKVKGTAWSHALHPDAGWRFKQVPLPRAWRDGTIAAGAAGLLLSAVFIGKILEAHVWEGSSPVADLSVALSTIVAAVYSLGIVLQNYRVAVLGRRDGPPPEECVAQMERAVARGDFREANRIYLAAVPDAGAGEAQEQTAAVLERIRLVNSGKLRGGGLFAPWRFEPRRFLSGSVAVVAVVVAVTILVPAAPARGGFVVDAVLGAAFVGVMTLFGRLNTAFARRRQVVTALVLGLVVLVLLLAFGLAALRVPDLGILRHERELSYTALLLGALVGVALSRHSFVFVALAEGECRAVVRD